MGGSGRSWVRGLQFPQGLIVAFMWSWFWSSVERFEEGVFCSQQTGMKVRGARKAERCQFRSASTAAETCLGFVPSSVIT